MAADQAQLPLKSLEVLPEKRMILYNKEAVRRGPMGLAHVGMLQKILVGFVTSYGRLLWETHTRE